MGVSSPLFKPTPAGLRRRQVTLCARNSAQDTFGQATGYTVYATVRAFIETLDMVRGLEKLTSSVVTNEVMHRINIRYQPGVVIQSKDRVLYATDVVNWPPPGTWPPPNGTDYSSAELRALQQQGARIFEIIAPLNLGERNIELNLMCTELNEGTPAGL
jgi:head-tail adaptor